MLPSCPTGIRSSPFVDDPALQDHTQCRAVNDPHTQIAAGLDQLVILTRLTGPKSDACSISDRCFNVTGLHSNSRRRSEFVAEYIAKIYGRLLWCRLAAVRSSRLVEAGSPPRSGTYGFPETVDRHHVQAIFVGIRTRTGAEGHARDEPLAEGIAQLAQCLEVAAGDAFVGFDLERQHPPVIELGNEVDLVAVVRAPVPGGDRLIEPGDLLVQLTDHERLQIGRA